MTKKSALRITLVTAAILMVPAVGMRFTDEVDWNAADFVVAGALLLGAGTAFELLARRAGNGRQRVFIGLGVAAALILVWASLAVGRSG
jgi:hypothetical protein